MSDILVDAPKDFVQIEGLPILDPLIYRSAEVFLEGKSRAPPDGPRIWDDGLSKNLDSLSAFIDAIVFEEQLPVFDYEVTFPADGYWSRRRFVELCNGETQAQVLVPVRVRGDAYTQSKDEAMRLLDQSRRHVPEQLKQDIFGELTALDYQWRPDLSRWDEGLPDSEQALLRFLLGSHLFGAYAVQNSGIHVSHAKRARLQVAVALQAKSGSYLFEDALYAQLRTVIDELKERIQIEYELPSVPTVLPWLLLQEPDSPEDVVVKAMRLRGKMEVKDYRTMRKSIQAQLRKGKNPIDELRDLSRIAAVTRRTLEAEAPPKLELGLSVSSDGPSLETTVSFNKLATWLYQRWPGRRYRKLLTRLAVAEAQWRSMTNSLHRLWLNA